MAPTRFSTAQLRECGRELVKMLMFRLEDEGDLLKQELLDLQQVYAQWVEAGLLQQFAGGCIKILDESRYTAEQLGKLPERLKIYSQKENPEVFKEFMVLNEKIQPKPALGINMDQENFSDSDDSECDDEVGSGIPKKASAEEEKIL